MSTVAMEVSDDITEPIERLKYRDAVIASFRMLQVQCGITAVTPASSDGTPISTSDNPYYLFRAFSYNRLPSHPSEEGLVCLLINKNIKDVQESVPTFTELLHKEVIKSENISIAVESMNDMGRDQTQLIIYVIGKTLAGGERRWKSQELKSALDNPECRAALSNIGVVDLVEVVEPDKRHIEQYLANPPPGVDAKSWQLAKSDNPDPSSLVPVQLIGFESLDRRLNCQCDFQERQKARLAAMAAGIDLLEKRHDLAKIRLDQFAIDQRHIAHRILRVMGVYERHRLSGTERKPYETSLESSLLGLLEDIEGLSKGRLREVQNIVYKSRTLDAFNPELPEISLADLPHITELFEEHQKGFTALVDILKEDLKVIAKLRQDIRGESNENCSR